MSRAGIIITSIVVIIVCIYVAHLRTKCSQLEQQIASIVPDTLVVHDTLTITEVKEVERRVVETKFLTIIDTIRQVTYEQVPLEFEERTYKDEQYEAVVYGYQPELRSLTVYPQTTYVTQTKEVKVKTRWGIGVQAGYGVTYAGQFKLSPYIGVGVSYNLITF